MHRLARSASFLLLLLLLVSPALALPASRTQPLQRLVVFEALLRTG